MKSGLLTLVSIMITVFLEVMVGSSGATCCPHLQGRRVTEATGCSETKICTSEATQCYEQEDTNLMQSCDCNTLHRKHISLQP